MCVCIDKRKLASNLVPIFISVDPSRDTVQQIRNYSQDFHPTIVSSILLILLLYT